MLDEIVGRARLAVRGEIRRRRAAHEPGRADAPSHQVLAAHRADAHRRVESLVDQVDHAIRQLELELHRRVLAHELRDGGREVLGAERHGSGQAQRAARNGGAFRRGRLRFLEVGEELDRPLVKRAPGLRQRDPARRAVEKAHAELRLEVGHEPRHGRHRHPEPRRSPGEAAGLDDASERCDRVKSIHRRLLHILQQCINCSHLYPFFGKCDDSCHRITLASTSQEHTQ